MGGGFQSVYVRRMRITFVYDKNHFLPRSWAMSLTKNGSWSTDMVDSKSRFMDLVINYTTLYVVFSVVHNVCGFIWIRQQTTIEVSTCGDVHNECAASKGPWRATLAQLFIIKLQNIPMKQSSRLPNYWFGVAKRIVLKLNIACFVRELQDKRGRPILAILFMTLGCKSRTILWRATT